MDANESGISRDKVYRSNCSDHSKEECLALLMPPALWVICKFWEATLKKVTFYLIKEMWFTKLLIDEF